MDRKGRGKNNSQTRVRKIFKTIEKTYFRGWISRKNRMLVEINHIFFLEELSGIGHGSEILPTNSGLFVQNILTTDP